MVQQDESADLSFAQQFFAMRGIVAERIPEGKSKTADLRLRRDGKVVGYCEVKSPQDIFAERLVAEIADVPPGRIGGIIERGPTSRQYRCLERAAKKAAAQLQAVNPAHAVPNLLMLVNHDSYSYHEDFVEAVTGHVGGHRTISNRHSPDSRDCWAQVFASSRRTATKFRRNQPRRQPNRRIARLAALELVAFSLSRRTCAVVVGRI
jgi:hypothetical protein